MLSKIQQIEETFTKYVRMYSVLLVCLVVASWSHSMMGGFFYPKPATVSSSQSCAFLHSGVVCGTRAAGHEIRARRPRCGGDSLDGLGALVTVECQCVV